VQTAQTQTTSPKGCKVRYILSQAPLHMLQLRCDTGMGKPMVFRSRVSWFWIWVKPMQTCIHSKPLPMGYRFFTVNRSYRPGSVATTWLATSRLDWTVTRPIGPLVPVTGFLKSQVLSDMVLPFQGTDQDWFFCCTLLHTQSLSKLNELLL